MGIKSDNFRQKEPKAAAAKLYHHSGVPIMCWSTILWMLAAVSTHSAEKDNYSGAPQL